MAEVTLECLGEQLAQLLREQREFRAEVKDRLNELDEKIALAAMAMRLDGDRERMHRLLGLPEGRRPPAEYYAP